MIRQLTGQIVDEDELNEEEQEQDEANEEVEKFNSQEKEEANEGGPKEKLETGMPGDVNTAR